MQYRTEILVAVVGTMLFSGCSISFRAKHVDAVSLSGDLTQQPGIYYALPKTAIDIAFPVEFTSFSGGELSGIVACRRDYETGLKKSDEPCELSVITPATSFGAATTAARAMIDYENVYRVTPDSSLFKSIQFEFTYDGLGYLSKADSSGQDDTVKVVTTVASAALSAFAGSATAIKETKAGKSKSAIGIMGEHSFENEGMRSAERVRRTFDYCGLLPPAYVDPSIDISTWAAKWQYVGHILSRRLRMDGPPPFTRLRGLTRAQVHCLTELINPGDGARAPKRAALSEEFSKQPGAMLAPGAAAIWLGQKEKEAGAEAAALAAARVALHIDWAAREVASHKVVLLAPLLPSALPSSARPSASGTSPYTVSAPAVAAPVPSAPVPASFQGRIANAAELCEPATNWPADGFRLVEKVSPLSAEPGWCVLKKSKLVVQASSAFGVDTTVGMLADFAFGRSYLVRIVPPDSGYPNAAALQASQSSGGYRYRIPAMGRVEVLMLQVNLNGICQSAALDARCRKAHAQQCSALETQVCETLTKPAQCVAAVAAKCLAKTQQALDRPSQSLLKSVVAEMDCTRDAETALCSATLLSKSTIPIAQLGLVAALPEKFEGTDAFLNFALTEAGALKNIKLGQKAQTGGELVNALGTLQEVRSKKQQSDTETAKAALDAPANARKGAIQQKKDELCIGALSDLALPAGTLPAVCQ